MQQIYLISIFFIYLTSANYYYEYYEDILEITQKTTKMPKVQFTKKPCKIAKLSQPMPLMRSK